jgi:hypothetical protein
MRGDRCLMWSLGDRFVGVEGRSLFDLRFRRSGFVGGEGRSLFDLRFRRSLDWISYNLRGCLKMWVYLGKAVKG